MGSAFAAQLFSGYSGSSGYSGHVGGFAAIPMTAGQALAQNDLVYIAVNGSYNQTAGQVYQTNASRAYASNAAWILGFATASASPGSTVNIQTSGSLSGFTNLYVGTLYYPSANAGQITSTPTATSPSGQRSMSTP